MPKLTPVTIKGYKATDRRREIPDSACRGLYLVIEPRPRGTMTWYMRLRRPDGRPGRVRLGLVDFSNMQPKKRPVIGQSLTLAAAHVVAADVRQEMARGVDVIEHYKAERHRRQTAAAEQAVSSFGACAREFFVAHKTKHKQRPRRWHEDAALLGLRWRKGSDPATVEPEIIRGGLADVWATKPVASIDGHDVHGVVADARKRRGDSRARKTHVALSTLFGWLSRERRVTDNPCRGVWAPGPPPARERVLDDAELAILWRACDAIATPYGHLFKLLALTGCRLREVSGMRRDELAADGVWTIPGARTKNHRRHVLPLPPLAIEIVNSLPVIGEAGFVFTSAGDRPVSSFATAKKELDAAMGAIAGKAVAEWRIHDVRRSGASGMQRLRIRSEVIERTLNHTLHGVAAVYQRDPLADEVREALARWAAHISGLVANQDNVLKLPADAVISRAPRAMVALIGATAARKGVRQDG